MDFPDCSEGKESAYNARNGFDPWVGKIPWGSEWLHTHSSILAWRITGAEEPGTLQSTGLQRVRQNWVTFTVFWKYNVAPFKFRPSILYWLLCIEFNENKILFLFPHGKVIELIPFITITVFSLLFYITSTIFIINSVFKDTDLSRIF